MKSIENARTASVPEAQEKSMTDLKDEGEGMSNLAQGIATIGPEDVTENELKAFDELLNSLSDDLQELRREGDLIEFLTELSESLRQGARITLNATNRKPYGCAFACGVEWSVEEYGDGSVADRHYDEEHPT